MNTTEHTKLRLSLRSIIIGLSKADPRYYLTLSAFDYAEKHHTGLRKDGVTPEFNHQLNILGFLITQIGNMEQPWIVLAVALLHDTYEDNNHLEDEFIAKFRDIFIYINRIAKVRRNLKLRNDEYYPEMALCPVCSIVKGADRFHNLTTIIGVMSLAKIGEAIVETEEFVLTMLKNAKKEHQRQTDMYELLKSLINIQLNNLRQYLALSEQH